MEQETQANPVIPVVEWKPRKMEKPGKPGEFVGKFITKCAPNTPGAINVFWKVGSKEGNYWGMPIDSISGTTVWVDKIFSDYGTELVIYLKGKKALNKVVLPYSEDFNLRTVINNLVSLKKELHTVTINIGYYVRKHLDKNKAPIMGTNGLPLYRKSLTFTDINPEFSYEEWMDFAQKEGLMGHHVTDSSGKRTWNDDAACKYWDGRLVGIQRWLLKQGTALPFTYNSLICREAPNPSGGGNLTAAEIQKAKEMYEAIRGNYRFSWQSGETSSEDAADALFNSPVNQQQQKEPTQEPAMPGYADFAVKPEPTKQPHEDIGNGGLLPGDKYTPPAPNPQPDWTDDLPF